VSAGAKEKSAAASGSCPYPLVVGRRSHKAVSTLGRCNQRIVLLEDDLYSTDVRLNAGWWIVARATPWIVG
jgi:hypothetical protein